MCNRYIMCVCAPVSASAFFMCVCVSRCALSVSPCISVARVFDVSVSVRHICV